MSPEVDSGRREPARNDSREDVPTLEEMIARQEQLVSELAAATLQHREMLSTLQRSAGGADTHPDRSTQPPAGADAYCNVGPDLKARLFGPFEAIYHGKSLAPWRSQRAASLLKYLLLAEGCEARRETLMEVFWPNSSPESARNSLNVCVYQLRSRFRELAPDRRFILFNAGRYGIHPDLELRTDVKDYKRLADEGCRAADGGRVREAIELLQMAISLHRGPLLEDDFSGEWCNELRRRLHVEHCALQEQLCRLLLETGDAGRAVAVGEELLQDDPYRETCHQLMMRAYAAMEQRHLIAEQFDRCQKVLRQELDVDPMRATVDLYHSLVRGD